jgi:hypothetical protein
VRPVIVQPVQARTRRGFNEPGGQGLAPVRRQIDVAGSMSGRGLRLEFPVPRSRTRTV